MNLTPTDEAPIAAGKERATPVVERRSVPVAVYFFLFTVSGFSGLIYESIWSHYLKLFLGHAAYAQSLVLAIFMGGMTIGAWLASRYSGRWRRPLLVYALVEGVVGVMALIFHDTFGIVTAYVHAEWLPTFSNATLALMAKWFAASLLIIPQSILLGMTFPLMAGGLLRRTPERPGQTLSMLYFTNSIGAAAGVLASGFWLIGHVGLPGTVLTTGVINVLVALGVWALARSQSDEPREVRSDPAEVLGNGTPTFAAPLADKPSASSVSTGPKTLLMLLLCAAFVTGAASFIYEIAWIRMLSLVLGSSTHSFELMLSAFITGLALGGLWIKRRVDVIGNVLRYAGIVQVAMGCVAVLTLPIYDLTFDWMAGLTRSLTPTTAGYGAYTAASHLIALAIMLPTTFIAGMTLPLITRALISNGGGEAAIGRVYAANTAGAIVGVIFATNIGLPWLGVELLIGAGALLDIGLGVWLLHRARSKADAARSRVFIPGVVIPAAIGIGMLVAVLGLFELDLRKLASGVYRTGQSALKAGSDVVFHRDGKTASVSLVEDPNGFLSITTNGKPDAAIQMRAGGTPTPDEVTMVLLATLPILYAPDATRAANIGFGSGLTTHVLLADDGLARVDTVEIEAAMTEAARRFGARVERAFEDPRSHIHIEDAKTFFSLAKAPYDIIIAEPSNPWVSGVASLFSEEFYGVVRSHLSERGVFVQWLQLYEFSDELAFSVFKALGQHFPDYAIYNADGSNLVIVATANERLQRPDYESIEARGIWQEMRRIGLTTTNDLAVRWNGSREMVASLFDRYGAPANSDYFPYLSLHAPAARFAKQSATLMSVWSTAPIPVLELIGKRPTAAISDASSYGLPRAEAIARANLMSGHLRAGTPLATSIPVGVQRAFRGVAEVARQCKLSSHDKVWFRALHEVMSLTLPFLTSGDAQDFLARLLPAECRETYAADVLVWLDLYQAVAARDANGLVTHGTTIVENRDGLEADRYAYALSAAMLGALNQRPAYAHALWTKYGKPVFERRGAPRYTELVVALARARSAP